MFYVYLITAIVFFALQGVLYGRYAREMDGITTAFVRNVSLIVVGLVALIFVPVDAYSDILQHRPMIILTAGLGIGHIALNYESYKHLPMGIAALLKKVSAIATGIVVGLVFLGEAVATHELILLGIIVTSSLAVGYFKTTSRPLTTSNYRKGLLIITLSGIFNTVSRRGYKTYADHLDPFLAAYILEASIGLVLLVLVPLYRRYTHTRPTITRQNIIHMSAISLLVIVGSICFTLALQTGSFIIANTLLVTTIPLIFVGGYLIYRESINRRQIIPIIIILVCLVLLNIT